MYSALPTRLFNPPPPPTHLSPHICMWHMWISQLCFTRPRKRVFVIWRNPHHTTYWFPLGNDCVYACMCELRKDVLTHRKYWIWGYHVCTSPLSTQKHTHGRVFIVLVKYFFPSKGENHFRDLVLILNSHSHSVIIIIVTYCTFHTYLLNLLFISI